MWIIDIRHWLNEQKDGPAVPELKLKVKKLAEIISVVKEWMVYKVYNRLNEMQSE